MKSCHSSGIETPWWGRLTRPGDMGQSLERWGNVGKFATRSPRHVMLYFWKVLGVIFTQSSGPALTVGNLTTFRSYQWLTRIQSSSRQGHHHHSTTAVGNKSGVHLVTERPGNPTWADRTSRTPEEWHRWQFEDFEKRMSLLGIASALSIGNWTFQEFRDLFLTNKYGGENPSSRHTWIPFTLLKAKMLLRWGEPNRGHASSQFQGAYYTGWWFKHVKLNPPCEIISHWGSSSNFHDGWKWNIETNSQIFKYHPDTTVSLADSTSNEIRIRIKYIPYILHSS